MKKFSKFIALCLGLLLLASCSASPELLSFLPETEDVFEGFGGKEFIIKGNWPGSWDPNTIEVSEAGALSAFQDALISHNAEIMEKYDCKITALEVDWDWAKDLAIHIMAYNVGCDLVDTNLNFMVDNIKSGYVNPWEYAEIDISDSEKYGPMSYLRASSFDGLHYGIWSNNWVSGIEYRGIVGVNNNILQEFTDSTVHELYENGKWTFDEFKNLLQLCATDETVIPLSYYDQKILVISSLLANGANLVSYNENSGKYTYGLLDRKALTALEFVQSLNEENLVVEEKDYDYYYTVGQNVAFTITETWCIGAEIENEDMICFPFGPDAEYGKDFGATRSLNNRYVYMPISADEITVGKFVDIWFEELEDLKKSDIVEDFKVSKFFNEESSDMWMTISENTGYDYGIELGDIYDSLCNAMTGAVFGGSSISSFIDSYSSKVSAMLNSTLNN